MIKMLLYEIKEKAKLNNNINKKLINSNNYFDDLLILSLIEFDDPNGNKISIKYYLNCFIECLNNKKFKNKLLHFYSKNNSIMNSIIFYSNLNENRFTMKLIDN